MSLLFFNALEAVWVKVSHQQIIWGKGSWNFKIFFAFRKSFDKSLTKTAIKVVITGRTANFFIVCNLNKNWTSILSRIWLVFTNFSITTGDWRTATFTGNFSVIDNFNFNSGLSWSLKCYASSVFLWINKFLIFYTQGNWDIIIQYELIFSTYKELI